MGRCLRFSRWLVPGVLLRGLFFAPLPLFAQGNTTSVLVSAASLGVVPPAAAMPVSNGLTLWQAWDAGGWIMWVLTALALVALRLVILQLPLPGAPRVAPPHGLLIELLDRIRAGELNEARRLCEDRPCPLSSIAMKAFDHLRFAPKAGVALLRDSVEAEGARQADVLLGQVQVMLDLSVIAPMVGLLGAVLGLLQMCGTTEAGAVRCLLQAGAFRQALVTTACGLLVAIPAMAAASWMRRRTTRHIAALESAAAEIVMAVASRYDR